VSIDAPETLNGQAPATPIRVKFGRGATQEIPLQWAEFMLNYMYETQKAGGKPKSFGDLLQLAAMEGK
jgi:hypothetical protein